MPTPSHASPSPREPCLGVGAVGLVAAMGCAGPSANASDSGARGSRSWTVVTFNTGTSESMDHDGPPADGYTSEHAERSDAWYGDGLAWVPAIEAARSWFAAAQPAVVGFQEVFSSDRCAEIPESAHEDFVCEGWTPGDPTVALDVLGPGYQVACHVGYDDKCLAVRTDVGRIAGCGGALCLDGLAGAPVEGCGSGARVGRAEIVSADGEPLLTVVHVHGTSGVGPEDQACRVAQVEQIFVDQGDGLPAARGDRNLVLGDLNTDPHRFMGFDDSAQRWTDFVGPDAAFSFHTEVGPDAPGSYGGLADIDHVASDAWSGGCAVAGLDGEPAVLDAVYFDHRPVSCRLTAR